MIRKHCLKIARVSLALLYLTLPAIVLAQSSSLIFERRSISIVASPQRSEDQSITLQRPAIALNVELRPEESLALEYIHTLNTLTNETGVMIALASPAIVSLPPMKVYTPVDTLFVGDDGTIVQIMPRVILGEITQTLQAKRPIKALLFLQAGMAASRAIHPRDIVIGPMFNAAPAMQE